MSDEGERLYRLSESLAGALAAGEEIDVEAWAERHDASEEEIRDALAALEWLGEESPAKAFDLAGLELPGLELGPELGRGANGIVRRARQPALDRDVAVKVLLPGVSAFDGALRRFRREAQSLARLRHRHVVAVHDVGRVELPGVGSLDYFVMDLVEGRSLARVLREEGALNPARAVRLVRQVASAVAYVHEQGLVHRDLKPANVLVDGEGDAYVADFGLAREVAVDTSLTATGRLLGTPLYMAPEQVRAGSTGDTVGEAADVWALGALLYECLAGRAPFAGLPLARLVHAIEHDEPPPLERTASGTPAALAWIARRAMAKDPAERYPTARAFLEDLERFEDGRAVRAARPSLWSETRRVLRRERKAALTALATVVALTALFMLFVAPRLSGDDRVIALAEEALDARDLERAVFLMRDVSESRFDELRPDVLAAALVARVDRAIAVDDAPEQRRTLEGVLDRIEDRMRARGSRQRWRTLDGSSLAGIAARVAGEVHRALGVRDKSSHRWNSYVLGSGCYPELLLDRALSLVESRDLESVTAGGALLSDVLELSGGTAAAAVHDDLDRVVDALVLVVRTAPKSIDIGTSWGWSRDCAALESLAGSRLASELVPSLHGSPAEAITARRLIAWVTDFPFELNPASRPSAAALAGWVEAWPTRSPVERLEAAAAIVRKEAAVESDPERRRLMTISNAPWLGLDPESTQGSLMTRLADFLGLAHDPDQWDTVKLAERFLRSGRMDQLALHVALLHCLDPAERAPNWPWAQSTPPPGLWSRFARPGELLERPVVQWALVQRTEQTLAVIDSGQAAADRNGRVRCSVRVPESVEPVAMARSERNARAPRSIDGRYAPLLVETSDDRESSEIDAVGDFEVGGPRGRADGWGRLTWAYGSGRQRHEESVGVGVVHVLGTRGASQPEDRRRREYTLLARAVDDGADRLETLEEWRDAFLERLDDRGREITEHREDRRRGWGSGDPKLIDARRLLGAAAYLDDATSKAAQEVLSAHPTMRQELEYPKFVSASSAKTVASSAPPDPSRRDRVSAERIVQVVGALWIPLALATPLLAIFVGLGQSKGWRVAFRSTGLLLLCFALVCGYGGIRRGPDGEYLRVAVLSALAYGALGTSLALPSWRARLPGALLLVGAAVYAVRAWGGPFDNPLTDPRLLVVADFAVRLGTFSFVFVGVAILRRWYGYSVVREAVLWMLFLVFCGGPLLGSVGVALAWLPVPELARLGDDLVREYPRWLLYRWLDDYGFLARCAALGLWVGLVRPPMAAREAAERERSGNSGAVVTNPGLVET